MGVGKFVSYLRVSTAKQGASGLGLEAQRAAVAEYLRTHGHLGTQISEFVEIESGKRADRPKLAEALALCRLYDATLVIAKLDRLSRDVHFLTGLQNDGARFVAADMPQANEMVVQMMAVVAQAERKMISARTKAALAAAKARGTVLGTPANLSADVAEAGRAIGRVRRSEMADAGAAELANSLKAARKANPDGSLRDIAAWLNSQKPPVPTPTKKHGAKWSAVQVSRLLKRVASLPAEPKVTAHKGLPRTMNRRSPENITKETPP